MLRFGRFQRFQRFAPRLGPSFLRLVASAPKREKRKEKRKEKREIGRFGKNWKKLLWKFRNGKNKLEPIPFESETNQCCVELEEKKNPLDFLLESSFPTQFTVGVLAFYLKHVRPFGFLCSQFLSPSWDRDVSLLSVLSILYICLQAWVVMFAFFGFPCFFTFLSQQG